MKRGKNVGSETAVHADSLRHLLTSPWAVDGRVALCDGCVTV